MECVYVLVVYVRSNGIGDGLTCPHWLILMMKKKGQQKGNLINCVCVMCWERVEGLLNHCWCDSMFVWLWTVQCYENVPSHHHLCEDVICIILSHWLWQVLCALRKNEYFRGCTISRDVSRVAMDTTFLGMYHAPRWLLLSRVVSCDTTDAWTYMSPWVPDRETTAVHL